MVRMEGTNMKRYAPFAYMVAAVVVIGMAVFGCLDDYEQTVEGLRPLPAAEPVETVPRTTVPTTKTLPIPVTTTARVVWVDTVPSEARCPEWWHLLRAFWPSGLHMDADRVMWAETRCQNLHRSSSGGIGYGDHGLFQINAVNLEYLAQYGITAADLMVPAQNVVAALILYKNAETMHGCGWQPWYSSVDYRAMCDAQQDR
jgi:hypothetical protein